MERLHLPSAEHWRLYGPLMLGAFIVMLPLMRMAERRGRVPQAMGLALIGLAAGSLALLPAFSGAAMVALLAVFFIAFNLLEALLPAQLTRTAPAQARGAATGLYATLQFLGTFAGGSLGGYLFGFGGAAAVASMGFAVLLAWGLLWWLLRDSAALQQAG